MPVRLCLKGGGAGHSSGGERMCVPYTHNPDRVLRRVFLTVKGTKNRVHYTRTQDFKPVLTKPKKTRLCLAHFKLRHDFDSSHSAHFSPYSIKYHIAENGIARLLGGENVCKNPSLIEENFAGRNPDQGAAIEMPGGRGGRRGQEGLDKRIQGAC